MQQLRSILRVCQRHISYTAPELDGFWRGKAPSQTSEGGGEEKGSEPSADGLNVLLLSPAKCWKGRPVCVQENAVVGRTDTRRPLMLLCESELGSAAVRASG